MDVVESNMGYELYADVPGFRAEDITISLDANSLTVSGATERAPYVCEPCHFHRRERPLEEGGMRYFGPRTFNLPNNIDTDKIQASLEGGVLVIVMPKLERDAPTTKVKIVTVAEAPEVPGMDTDVGRSIPGVTGK